MLAMPPNRSVRGCHAGFLCSKLPAPGMPTSTNVTEDIKAYQCGNGDIDSDAPGGAFQD